MAQSFHVSAPRQSCTIATEEVSGALSRNGFSIVPSVVSAETIAELILATDELEIASAARMRNDRVYAVRNLLSAAPAIRRLAEMEDVRRLIAAELGSAARPVRAILFDKTPGANWKVAWHQDLSIAVHNRIETAGYGPWSVKAGVVHVQPPAALLAGMLTLRLHLDDCGLENGPLQVLPGSHAQGVLTPEEIIAWRESTPAVPCLLAAGGAVLMRPLCLHASSSAQKPGRRRVIHIEWSAQPLPNGLEWDEG